MSLYKISYFSKEIKIPHITIIKESSYYQVMNSVIDVFFVVEEQANYISFVFILSQFTQTCCHILIICHLLWCFSTNMQQFQHSEVNR